MPQFMVDFGQALWGRSPLALVLLLIGLVLVAASFAVVATTSPSQAGVNPKTVSCPTFSFKRTSTDLPASGFTLEGTWEGDKSDKDVFWLINASGYQGEEIFWPTAPLDISGKFWSVKLTARSPGDKRYAIYRVGPDGLKLISLFKTAGITAPKGKAWPGLKGLTTDTEKCSEWMLVSVK